MPHRLLVHTGLCVGGPNDAECVTVHKDQTRIRLTVPPKVDLRRMMSRDLMFKPTFEPDFEISNYYRESICGIDKVFYYWRHESLTVDQALSRLFFGYSEFRKELK